MVSVNIILEGKRKERIKKEKKYVNRHATKCQP